MVFFVFARSRFGLGAASIQELDKISSVWKEFISEVNSFARLNFRYGDANIQEFDKQPSIWKKLIRNTNAMRRIVEHTSFVNIFISFMSTIIVILLLREFAFNSVIILTSFEFYSPWKDVIDYLYQSSCVHLSGAKLLYLGMSYVIPLIDRTFLIPMKSVLALLCFALPTFTFFVTAAYVLDPDNIPQSKKTPKEMVKIQKVFVFLFFSYSNNSRILWQQRHVDLQISEKNVPAELHNKLLSLFLSNVWQLDAIDVR